MVSKLSKTKECIMTILSDGKEHTSEEMKDILMNEGIENNRNSSILRTAIYYLRNEGIKIYSRDRGIYQLEEKKEVNDLPVLNGFFTLIPHEKTSPCCVYVHEDGRIVLNGKMNSEIVSRQIEIRINENGDKIALIPNGKVAHKFTKSGCTKNVELVNRLKKQHIVMPAVFDMNKDEKSDVWIGSIAKKLRKKTKKV